MPYRLPPRILFAILGLGSFLVTSGVLAQGKAKSGEDIYKETLKATVWIVVPKGPPVSGRLTATVGTGSLIQKSERIVVTNYHVVGDAEQVHVFFPAFEKGRLIAERDYYQKLLPKGGSILGKVKAKDPKRDLALIQLATLPAGVRALPLAKGSPSPGQRVHSIGNPGGSGALWVYMSGDVRQVYRKQWKAGEPGRVLELDAQVVETQSPTNKGDSGGPLVNEQGQLVAVTQGSATNAQLLSLFIDVSEVKTLLAGSKITVPASPTTVAAEDKPKTEPKQKGESKPDAATLTDNQKAEQALDRAKTMAANGKLDVARERYEEIIKKYPKTLAADEARELLKKK